MIEIDRNRFSINIKQLWFCDEPYDIEHMDAIYFYSTKKDVHAAGFEKEVFSTLIIDTTKSLDAMWAGMQRSSCRARIKRAERDGITVGINEGYEEFIEINREFRSNKGLIPMNYSLDYYMKYGILFIFREGDEILGGHFYLKDDLNMRSLVAASQRLNIDEDKKTLVGNGNRLIIWEAMKYANANGISCFDMGGFYSGAEPDPEKENINQFKQGFGGEICNVYNYRKSYSLKFRLAEVLMDFKGRF